ncbi:MAG TPA: transglycosylase domain-containing protein [Ferruginibacter sp.]|nr:transglycosylase domain-containing protein [Ferruginibacter sp.]HMP20113.1 transglycosylase domain-containing protein [Ferruginibacter sp.]
MKKSVRIMWKIFFIGLGVIVLVFASASIGLFGKMPSLKELENPEADLASEVYTADGKLMGKYYSENRSEVKYHEISPNIINALIATEDERFKQHSGIDGWAIARALISMGRQGGGSTITQQLAKMMLGQGRGSFITRGFQKIKEWIVAVKLERNFTKEEIIALYLNRAPWGSNYGIRNASRTYYQKEPSQLNIEEAAVLVGMLKGFIYDPVRHPKASIDRRNTVIEQMAKAGYLTPEQTVKLKAKPLITNYKKPDESLGIAPYFRAVLADKLKAWCKSHTNLKTGENYDLYRDGLKIYTTIDSKMQQYAEESVIEHMPVIQQKLNYIMKLNGEKMWKDKQNIIEAAMKMSERWKALKEEEMDEEEIRQSFTKPVRMKVFAWNAKREKDTVMTPIDSIKYHKQLLQTSFVAMDPKTGEVKCWVGGIDFKWFKYDHVTALRQVGSTIKPLIYTLGVHDAGYTPSTVIPGGPVKYGNEYRTFRGGGGTMANCLAFSKNTASVYLTNVVGVKRVLEFSRSVGIEAKLPPYTSIALGAAEIPMLQMLQSYTMFPNKGYNTEPLLITRIEDKNGNLLQEFATETKLIITEQDAYTMVKLMQGVVNIGTGRSLNNYSIPAEKAGKTGTTNGNTDGWFIGYTPELIAGTWVGCDDPFIRIYSGTSGGNEMALPKWGFFMKKVYADKSLPYGVVTKFEEPAEFMNDPIYADVNFENLVNKGDEVDKGDMGNGNASDFLDEPETDYDYLINKIESESNNKPSVKKDSAAKPKTDNPDKPSEKKDNKPAANNPANAVKQQEDKNKKQEKSKTDY